MAENTTETGEYAQYGLLTIGCWQQRVYKRLSVAANELSCGLRS